MCGIVGYVGNRPCRDLLVAGLEKLEYRGYDSAGISLLADGEIDTVRAVGNLANLRAAVGLDADRPITERDSGCRGRRPAGDDRPRPHAVGDPRARHRGKRPPARRLLRQHSDRPQRHRREPLRVAPGPVADGHIFSSETDAEIVAHLIERHYDGDLTDAVRNAFADLRGHYAFVAMHAGHPDTLVAARQECPLIVGLGAEESFVASAIPAFMAETRHVLGLKNGEIVTVTGGEARIEEADGTAVEREIEEVTWDQEAAEKAGYSTFMMKEIHEQPDAVAETIADRLSASDHVDLSELELDPELVKRLRRIVIVACGTSYHAGLVGRYAIEQWARVPVEMDVASEYRYRDPVVSADDLVIGITQSGETADTLAAMRLARERGATVMAVTNVMGSQATRDADAVLYTRAGIEIGVAATKTFTSQVAAMYLLGLWLAQERGSMEASRTAELITEMKALPHLIQETITSVDGRVRAIARSHYERRFFLYLGRNIGLPVCLEGALKLKEISYIPTDAYAAGEMKHGPIALLDENTPVVTVATNSPVLEKVLSNVSEVRARGADVIAVATEGASQVAEACDQTLFVPSTDWILQPILAVLPLQLLAYYIARLNGLNVDQPRNLAKTVTVE